MDVDCAPDGCPCFPDGTLKEPPIRVRVVLRRVQRSFCFADKMFRSSSGVERSFELFSGLKSEH